MIFGILGALLSLSVIIIVHELGHLIVAKKYGVKVECFSIGFGPKLLKFKIKDTLYALSLIPFGGYVRMAGEAPDEAKGEVFEYMSHPPSHRAIIVTAGSIFNLLFGFLLFWIIGVIGVQMIQIPAQIYKVEEGSRAKKIGLMEKDVFFSINKERVKDWYHLEALFAKNIKKEVDSIIKRGEKMIKKKIFCTLPLEEFGITPLIPPVIGGVKKGYPAQEAGILPKDKILKINNILIESWQHMQQVIERSGGEELNFIIERGKDVLSITLKPCRENGKMIIGVYPETIKKRYGVFEAAKNSMSSVIKFCGYVIYLLKELLLARLSLGMLVGPVGIVHMMSEQIGVGVMHLLFFVGFLSINLAILNMLPIPLLDGGALLLLLVEKIKGRPLSKNTYKIVHQIGICIVLSLILLVTFNDIARILK